MITGIIRPSLACACVAALNCLQNSMMLTPCCPSARPMGGAGLALPAGIWSFTCPVTFFMTACDLQVVRTDGIEPSSHRLLHPRVHPGEWVRHRAQPTSLGTGLLHLHEVQFHGSGATKNRDQHLHPALVRIHLFHRPVEVAERTVDDPHRVAIL